MENIVIHSDLYIIGPEMTTLRFYKLKSFIDKEQLFHPTFNNWTIHFLKDGVSISFEHRYGNNKLENEIASLIPFLKECSKCGFDGKDVITYTITRKDEKFGVGWKESGGLFIDINLKITKIIGIDTNSKSREITIDWGIV